jgi:hypothetical protein
VSYLFLNVQFILTTGCFYEMIRTRFRLMKGLIEAHLTMNDQTGFEANS